MSDVGKQLLSGALSGLASTVALQPFDFLKTRVQQREGPRAPQASTAFGIARRVLVQDGALGLWRGTSASLVRNIPGVALYMTSLTQIRAYMAASPHLSLFHVGHGQRTSTSSSQTGSVLPKLSSGGNLLSGAFTRVAVGFLMNPITVVKARFESDMYTYTSLRTALVSVARGGPPELFRGFVASSLRDAPYAGLFVVFYEGIKREASRVTSSSGVSPSLVHGTSAALAGAVATLLTHPFDVVKTKIQVRPESRYASLWATTVTTWAQAGPRGFFDGAGLRLSRKVLSSAIGWAVYEAMVRVQMRVD